jgi:hypothetical protein
MARVRFRTSWRLPGEPRRVWAVLSEPGRIAAGWPDVLHVDVSSWRGLRAGSLLDWDLRTPVGTRLRFTTRLLDAKSPDRIRVQSRGDLEGEGMVLLEASQDGTRLTFDWNVAPRPWAMRLLAWIPGGTPILRRAHDRVLGRARERILELLATNAQRPPRTL